MKFTNLNISNKNILTSFDVFVNRIMIFCFNVFKNSWFSPVFNRTVFFTIIHLLWLGVGESHKIPNFMARSVFMSHLKDHITDFSIPFSS